MRIALLQVNPVAGDIRGNAERIAKAAEKAAGADLVVTPELALVGYPPRDLLLSKALAAEARDMLNVLAMRLRGIPCALVGTIEENPSSVGRPLFNSAAVLRPGRDILFMRKTLLPTYDVFDEDRYFEPATEPQLFHFRDTQVGVSICEDVWNDEDFWHRRRYHEDPIKALADRGAGLIVNLSASPFTVGKQALRERMLGAMAARRVVTLAYCNQVGGNDDIVFDGRSSVFSPLGTLMARGKSFEEDVVVFDMPEGPPNLQRKAPSPVPPSEGAEEEVWRALVLGVRDFVGKCGFKKAHLGLSGGIDSSLVAAVACEALGPDNVDGILMPSPYSSSGSVRDAHELAQNLGMKTAQIPIEGIMGSYQYALALTFAGTAKDVTEENIQARIRGALLMAYSNKFGSMLLTTGNKSEMAVGYCTLYGDMNGGLAVISDVPKTMVYRVARWLNQQRIDQGRYEVIPWASIEKPPSAELRPNQTDQDSLPPYEVLDAILEAHVERMMSAQGVMSELLRQGLARETAELPMLVEKVLAMVRRAEFKRRQAAPGLKITDRAFGTGWRMPIARG